MIDYQDIARVMRRLDEEASSVGFEALLEKLGIEPEGAMNVAKQRALRMYMIDHGVPLGLANFTVSDTELLSPAATWLDGFVAGVNLAQTLVNPPDDQHRASGR